MSESGIQKRIDRMKRYLPDDHHHLEALRMERDEIEPSVDSEESADEVESLLNRADLMELHAPKHAESLRSEAAAMAGVDHAENIDVEALHEQADDALDFDDDSTLIVVGDESESDGESGGEALSAGNLTRVNPPSSFIHHAGGR